MHDGQLLPGVPPWPQLLQTGLWPSSCCKDPGGGTLQLQTSLRLQTHSWCFQTEISQWQADKVDDHYPDVGLLAVRLWALTLDRCHWSCFLLWFRWLICTWIESVKVMSEVRLLVVQPLSGAWRGGTAVVPGWSRGVEAGALVLLWAHRSTYKILVTLIFHLLFLFQQLLSSCRIALLPLHRFSLAPTPTTVAAFMAWRTPGGYYNWPELYLTGDY